MPVHDPEWNATHDLDDVSSLLREEIEHFFAIYKDLEPDRVTAIEGWSDRAAAEREIGDARARFDQRAGTHA